ncbi:unnamed protein product [Alternaria alternata]
MDGDVCPLKQMVEVVEEVLGHERGYIVMDEAHSTGVLGPEAILLGSETLRHYLINYARPLIYTTFLSYPSLALIRSSYRLLRSGQSVGLQAHLQSLTQHLYTSLSRLQRLSDMAHRVLTIPSACPRSPIFAVQLAKPKVLASFLQSHSMMVRAVVPPTVPVGTARVRICLHAGNTFADLERLVELLGEWCESQAAEMLQDNTLEPVTRAKL